MRDFWPGAYKRFLVRGNAEGYPPQEGRNFTRLWRAKMPPQLPSHPVTGRQTLFLCQMRDFPADPECRAPDCDLRASAGSYAHKGMHMAWMEKVRKRAQKPVKTDQKT
ncbi:unnamed protein product [marine sediment metagenome]|uniref:Uncharacterized protein n=1 Tax=marine sediment metagenome TaxID=412755 RepID=X0ZFV9_9ZZZZ